MANLNVKIAEEITPADTNENTIVLVPVDDDLLVRPLTRVKIAVNGTGTIQFAVGETIGASQKAYGNGESLILLFRHNLNNIRFKASATTAHFTVTIE
jgi:hypothetical protein